ncbi:MAG: Smr/MutS family protein [Zetaproteobacteria bacterium]|nr:Smr/MutS family protein [Zetaproteobacteria bacterium]
MLERSCASQQALTKLGYPQILQLLQDRAQTQAGRLIVGNMQPNLSLSEIQTNWQRVEPLTNLAKAGHTVHIGDLSSIDDALKLAQLGGMLHIAQWVALLQTLEATQNCLQFARKWSTESWYLESIRETLKPLPEVRQLFFKCIDHEGNVKDAASAELATIRTEIRQIAGILQGKANQLQNDPTWKKYLTNASITERNGRYVLAVRMDGRGRIRARVIEVGVGGNIIYVEPENFVSLNEKRIGLENSEKIEVYKVYQKLAQLVVTYRDEFITNYQICVQLDVCTAQAKLSCVLNCHPIQLIPSSDSLYIHLKKTRHPLLIDIHDDTTVPNDIILLPNQRGFILSGPNAGGKTVILKTVGLFQLMVKTGLMLPCSPDSQMSIAENIYIEMGDAQSLESNLSTFSGHLEGLQRILHHARNGDLVLLDELCVGTQPLIGQALGQAILEELILKNITVFVTTHYDGIKQFAGEHPQVRCASMQFDLDKTQSTFQLQLDIPGQSYGIELAHKKNIPANVTARAKQISGAAQNNLEETIAKLNASKADLDQQKQSYQQAKADAEHAKSRWQHEIHLNQQHRSRTTDMLKEKYIKLLNEMREEWQQEKFQRKQERKASSVLHTSTPHSNKLKQFERQLKHHISEMSASSTASPPQQSKEAVLGAQVKIPTLRQQGTIVRVKGQGEQTKYLVQTPLARVSLSLQQFKIIKDTQSAHKDKKTLPTKKNLTRGRATTTSKEYPQIPSAQIDLRGQPVDQSIDKLWAFIDKAITSGDTYVWVIHGHGTQKLKQAVRSEIEHAKHYTLSWQAGSLEQGGDGVTLVILED